MQTWTTSTVSSSTIASALSYALSAPRRRAAARDRSGVEAATPATVPPAARTAWAWTAPTNPVPAIAERSGVAAFVRIGTQRTQAYNGGQA